MAALAARVWGAAGGVGLTTYAFYDSLHNYVGADLGVWALLAGRRSSADSVLQALLHWRNASGLSCELFSRRTRDFGRNLPPHPTSAAALVAQVRHALIHDDDDTLRLTLGARPLWWKGSKIERAPTRWGAIDLSFREEGDAAQWSWTAVPVWTRLTLPPGRTWRGPLPEPLRPGPDATVVLAPPRSASARVALAVAGGRP
jgi:hypothetical protein